MKVDISPCGELTIYAENDLESYALSKWLEQYNSSELEKEIIFGVDTLWYKTSKLEKVVRLND